MSLLHHYGANFGPRNNGVFQKNIFVKNSPPMVLVYIVAPTLEESSEARLWEGEGGGFRLGDKNIFSNMGPTLFRKIFSIFNF